MITLTNLKKNYCMEDSLKLQTDLDNLYKRCNNNEVSTNIDKCFTISYSFKKNKPGICMYIIQI